MLKWIKTGILSLTIITAAGTVSVYAEQNSVPDLEGEWQLAYSIEGASLAEQIVCVYDNNTFDVLDEGESASGSWSFDGGTLILSSDGEDVALAWNPQTGQLTGEYSGMNITMSRSGSSQEEDTYAEETDTGMIMGGWETAEDPAITDDLNNLFQLALDSYQTGTITIAYTPVIYLGSQVVAGTNHAFLCRASEINKGSKWVIVFVYEDLQGEATVMNIADFDYGSFCTYGAE